MGSITNEDYCVFATVYSDLECISLREDGIESSFVWWTQKISYQLRRMAGLQAEALVMSGS